MVQSRLLCWNTPPPITQPWPSCKSKSTARSIILKKNISGCSRYLDPGRVAAAVAHGRAGGRLGRVPLVKAVFAGMAGGPLFRGVVGLELGLGEKAAIFIFVSVMEKLCRYAPN